MTEIEAARARLAEDINRAAVGMVRADFEKTHGKVWDSRELVADFEVHGFLAPFVRVVRRSDNAAGSLEFSHDPRFYWGFQED